MTKNRGDREKQDPGEKPSFGDPGAPFYFIDGKSLLDMSKDEVNALFARIIAEIAHDTDHQTEPRP